MSAENTSSTHVTPMLDELENGPWPSFISGIKRLRDDHPDNRINGIANDLLGVMNRVLSDNVFLASNNPTIADVAAYSYIAHAPEGGVSLDAFPAVEGWLSRIEALDGFVPMQATKAGLKAA